MFFVMFSTLLVYNMRLGIHHCVAALFYHQVVYLYISKERHLRKYVVNKKGKNAI